MIDLAEDKAGWAPVCKSHVSIEAVLFLLPCQPRVFRRWLNIQTWHFSVVRLAQFFPGPPAHIIHVYACYRDSNWVWTRRWMAPPSSFRGWLGFLIWAPAAAHHLITDGNMWAEGLELRTAACHLLESTCSLSLLLVLGKYGPCHISTI